MSAAALVTCYGEISGLTVGTTGTNIVS